MTTLQQVGRVGAPHPDHRNPYRAEVELRPLLDDVTLVGELDLEGPVGARALDVLQLVGNTCRDLATAYPASLVVGLVTHGIEHYEDGAFWPALVPLGLTSARTGPQFVEALRRFGLETFDELIEFERAHPYVSRALLHGGVPRSCARHLFQLLVDELSDGEGDGSCVIARWRADLSRLAPLHRPVRRFLLEGGRTAADLVERMADLVVGVQSGADPETCGLGLPAHLRSAALDLQGLGQQATTRRRRVPSPSLRIEEDGAGPTLTLPVVPPVLGMRAWTVQTDRVVRRHPASTVSPTDLSVEPATTWAVHARRHGGASQVFTFEGVRGAPILLFDPSTRRLLRSDAHVTTPSVFVVCPTSYDCRLDDADGPPAPPVELHGPLFGAWHRYSLHHVQVTGSSALWIGPSQDARAGAARVVPVGRAHGQPELVGDRVDGATCEGAPVFAAPPRLRLPPGSAGRPWRVRITWPDGVVTMMDALSLQQEGGNFDLSSVLDGPVGLADVHVIGPLGQDVRSRVAWVADLEVDRPRHLLAPEEPASVRVVASPEVVLEADRFDLPVPPAVSRLTVGASSGRRSVAVEIDLHRLSWTVRSRRSTELTYGQHPVALPVADVRSGDTDVLMVRTGLPVPVSAVLLGDGCPRQEHSCMDASGRATIPLSRFVDTVTTFGSSVAELEVRAGGVSAIALRLIARYEVSDVEVEATFDGSHTLLHLRFRENKAFRERVVRLWSVERPWGACTVLPVPEEARGEALLHTVHLPPGRYLFELGVHEPWKAPRRPRPGSGEPVVDVGTEEDVRRRLELLDRTVPLHTFELLLQEFADASPLDDDAAQAVARPALLVLAAAVSIGDTGQLRDRRVRCARSVLMQVPEAAARAFVEALERDDLTHDELLRVVIALLPDLLDCPAGPLDGSTHVALWRAHPVLARRPTRGGPRGPPGGGSCSPGGIRTAPTRRGRRRCLRRCRGSCRRGSRRPRTSSPPCTTRSTWRPRLR